MTLPNDKLDELTASEIEAAFNCTPADAEMPVALADTVTACATFTAATVAEKLPLVEPAGSAIEAGTTNDELLLVRPTVRPPLGTVVFVVTVQLSVPAPVIVVLAQFNLVSLGTPLPFSPIFHEAPLDALLLMERLPVVDPVAAGLNCKVRVAV